MSMKCVNKYAVSKFGPFFTPLQVGIATLGSGQAVVHAARGFVTDMTQEQIFIKLDFANAFNTMRRDVMLQAVYDTISKYAFAHQSYSAKSILQFGSLEVRSQFDPQQRDPLGPLLFCLPLQSVLRTLEANFCVGYLDDISLGGNLEHIRHDLSTITDLELSMGLRLNRLTSSLPTQSSPASN